MPEERGVKAAGAAPVVVTDGETRPALAATRSLGARGIPTHVVAARAGSLAGVSRHASAEHVLVDPWLDPERWRREVLELAAGLGGALILPVTEVAMATLLAGERPAGVGLAAPPREAFALASDKHALLERAARAGLEVPRSRLVEEPERLEALPEPLGYPAILKARRSRWLEAGRWQAGGVVRVDDPEALRRAARAPDFRAGALVQEFVPGRGEGVFLLADHGRTRVRFAHRRVREKPPAGGVSVLAESREPEPALAEACERLLAELGWHGLAMLEFRRTPDGRAVLMELNPRLWGSVQLAVDAGVDFPWLAVALQRGAALGSPKGVVGVRTRWLLGDLDHLLVALRRREQRRALGRSALGVCAAFVRSFFDGTRLEVWRRDDRRPFLRELRQWRA